MSIALVFGHLQHQQGAAGRQRAGGQGAAQVGGGVDHVGGVMRRRRRPGPAGLLGPGLEGGARRLSRAPPRSDVGERVVAAPGRQRGRQPGNGAAGAAAHLNTRRRWPGGGWRSAARTVSRTSWLSPAQGRRGTGPRPARPTVGNSRCSGSTAPRRMPPSASPQFAVSGRGRAAGWRCSSAGRRAGSAGVGQCSTARPPSAHSTPSRPGWPAGAAAGGGSAAPRRARASAAASTRSPAAKRQLRLGQRAHDPVGAQGLQRQEGLVVVVRPCSRARPSSNGPATRRARRARADRRRRARGHSIA